MSRLSDRFAESALPGLKDELGDEVTYTAPDGTQTTCTALLDDEETRREYDSGGQALRRVRQVTIFKSDVDPVSVNGTVTIAGVVWAGFAVLAESAVATVLEVVRIGTAEVSRPAYRRQG